MYQVVGNFDNTAVGSPSYIKRIDSPTNMGAVYGYTAAVRDDGRLWFLTETGFYALDQRMIVNKISQVIDPTTQSLDLTATVANAKSFNYTTAAEWAGSGYISTGGKLLSAGGVSNFSDTYSIVDAVQGENMCACAMDASMNLHIAYVKQGTIDQIRYARVDALTGVITYEDAFVAPKSYIIHEGPTYSVACSTAANQAYGVDIAVNDAGTKVLIAIKIYGGLKIVYGVNHHSNGVAIHERVGGVWTNLLSAGYCGRADSGAGGRPYATVTSSVVIRYLLNSDDFRCFTSELGGLWLPAGPGGTRVAVASGVYRTGGVMSYPNLGGFGIAHVGEKFSGGRDLNGNTLVVGLSPGSASVIVWFIAPWPNTVQTSFNPGLGTFAATDSVQISSDSINFADISVSFTLGGSVYRRDFAVGSDVLYAGADKRLRGFFKKNNLVYDLVLTGASGETATYIFEDSFSRVETPSGRNSSAYEGSYSPMQEQNSVFSYINFGANANEIILRRFSFRVVYTSDERFDAALTSWGAYSPTQAVGANSVNHEVAQKATAGATDFIAIAVTFFQRYGRKLYAGSSTNGNVYVMNQGYLADTASYACAITTKEDLLGSLELEKDIYKVYVLYEIKDSGTFTLSYRLDNYKDPLNNAAWINTTVDTTKDGFAEVLVGNKARSIQFKCSANSGSASIGVLGFVIMYGMLNAR